MFARWLLLAGILISLSGCAGGIGFAPRPLVTPASPVTPSLVVPTPTPVEERESAVTLMGTVMDVSMSARIILLERAAQGFRLIALSEDCELATTGGEAITLRDIRRGMTVQASGRPGESEALIAKEVLVAFSTPNPPSPAAVTAVPTDLEAVLRAPAELPAGGPITLEFTLFNRGTAGRYVLRWYTPLEGICGKIFRVTRDGELLEYQGPLVMRGDPSPDDYVWLDPGASVTATVDLATVYDLTQPGTYTIAFPAPRISDVAGSIAEMASSVDELGPIEMASNDVVITITGGGDVATLPRSMKGYELYSWLTSAENRWTYTLITGTNRDKSFGEITSPENLATDDGWVKITVQGVPALKAVLDRLPEGEDVTWLDIRRVAGTRAGVDAFPDQAVVEEIVEYCEQHDIRMDVAN